MSNSSENKFNWNDFMVLAEELASRSDPAAKRSAISRAYYAVYHRANQRLSENKFTHKRHPNSSTDDSGNTAHAWCWTQYVTSNHEGCQELGALGREIKSSRRTADYEDVFRGDLDRKTDFVIQRAKSFIKKFDDMDPTYPERPTTTAPAGTRGPDPRQR